MDEKKPNIKIKINNIRKYLLTSLLSPILRVLGATTLLVILWIINIRILVVVPSSTTGIEWLRVIISTVRVTIVVLVTKGTMLMLKATSTSVIKTTPWVKRIIIKIILPVTRLEARYCLFCCQLTRFFFDGFCVLIKHQDRAFPFIFFLS